MKTAFQGFLAFALLAFSIYGLFVLARAGIRVLSTLNSDIAVAIIAASATVLVAVVSVVVGKIYESRMAVQKELRERKVPVYDELLTFMFRVLTGEKTGNAPSEQEMLEFLVDCNRRMMVWGSDAVLAEWSAWRKLLVANTGANTTTLSVLFQYEKLILAIRKDLGHENKNIARGDVLALFVNDLHEVITSSGS